MRAAAWVGLAVLVLAPLAIAAPGAAEIYADTRIDIREASAAFAPLALYTDGAEWEGGALSCEHLRVTRFSSERAQAGAIEVPLGRAEESYAVTNGVARFVAVEPTAWIGVYPTASTQAALPGAAPLITLEAGGGRAVGNARSSPEAEPAPDRPSYSYGSSGDSIAVTTFNDVQVVGDLMIKLSGSVLEVVADENRSSLDTRGRAMDGFRHERAWAFLECEDGVLASVAAVNVSALSTSLEIGSAAHVQTYARRAVVAVDGGEADASGEVFVRGNVSGLASVVRETTDPVTRLTISGDIVASSVAVAPAPTRVMWPWIAIGGLAVVLGVAGVLVKVRHHPTDLSVDQLVELAAESAERGRFAVAIEWIDLALDRVGPHPRLLADKAHFVAETGDTRGAVEIYKRAIEAGSLEALILYARLLIQLGEDDEAAARAIVRALEGDPTIAFDLADDAVFARLRQRRDVQAAMRSAARRLG